VRPAWLFPEPARSFPGARWVRIGLRTAHLIAMGLLVGGVAAGSPPAELPWAFWGTVVTGAAFVAVELHASGLFLLQLKGLAVLFKAVLLAGVALAPQAALAQLVAAIVVGGISSHMPGRFRYFSPFHGRVIKA